MNTNSHHLLLSVVRQQTALLRALPHAANRALASAGRVADCPPVDGEVILLEARLEAGTRGVPGIFWLLLAILAMAPLSMIVLLAIRCLGFLAGAARNCIDASSTHANQSGISNVGAGFLVLVVVTIYLVVSR